MSVLADTTCVACERRMGDVDSCTDEGYPFVIDGEIQWLSAIPYGDDREEWGNREPPEHCHDCNVVVGEVHHWGCDMARCPNCDDQFFGCECDMPEPGDPRLEHD